MRDLVEKLGRANGAQALDSREVVLLANWSGDPLVLYDAQARQQAAQRLAQALADDPAALQSMAGRPFILSVEGLDGSGKQLQTEKLHAYLKGRGVRTQYLEFPQYDSFFGREIGALLSGAGERSAADVDVKSMCLWFALDRWKHFGSVDTTGAEVLLINRFTLSNVAYQCARQGPGWDEKLVYWVNRLEHVEFGLPVPDLYIYLDVNSAASRANNEGKGHRAYVGEDIDVYEKSSSLQNNARAMYLELARRQPNVRVVECMAEGDAMRPIEDIHREMVALLEAEMSLTEG